jgi:hypothetical protein
MIELPMRQVVMLHECVRRAVKAGKGCIEAADSSKLSQKK